MSTPAIDLLEISSANDGGDESIVHKHRRERKELQAKIQSLKKSASKGDKKKRKEVLEEITKLEQELDKRQSEELNNINDEKSITNTSTENLTLEEGIVDDVNTVVEYVKDEPQQQRLSKAQKRRDKKAREKKALEEDILAQEELNKNGPRMLETCAIIKILKGRGLSLQTVPSDGDCLYNAIRHQLELIGHSCITNISQSDQISYLRNETANYILKNKDTLIFYMTNSSDTEDLLSDEKFTKYCEQIRNTPAWGGQIEIKALANILKVSIEVLQATGPPTIQKGDIEDSMKSTSRNLIITYHRHMYSLGEHYNSTKPFVDGEDEEINTEMIQN